MMDFLQWLEQSSFPTWVRESPSVWAYPMVLLLHTIGMGVVCGINAGIDLRLMGIARAIPVGPMRKFLPILWAGFWMNAVTGTILVMQDATTKLRNVDFYVKMIFIALAIINLKLIKTRVFEDPELDKGPLPENAKILALTSIFFWLGAITAGRLLAYV